MLGSKPPAGGPLTFVGHPRARLQIEAPAAAARAHLPDVVAQRVATVLAAVQAHALIEGAVVRAAVGGALHVLVQQGVDEEVDGALVGALHGLLKTCPGKSGRW